MKQITFITILSLLAASCAGRNDGQSSPSPASALPSSWVQPLESSGSTEFAEEPTPAADRSVRAAFGAHVQALPAVAFVLPGQSEAGLVPWHLDGMIANFAVDVGGLFGALMLDGAAAVKAVWRRSAPAQVPAAPPRSKPAIRFASSVRSDADLARLLEPAVRAALAAKTVRNESNLRRNLTDRGRRFLALSRALERTGSLPGWRVDGLELELHFNAQGEIMPAVAVGADVGIVFNWAMPERAAPLAALGGEIGNAEQQFLRALSGVLPADAASIGELRDAGFALDEIQVGIVAGAGGSIGIVSASAEADAKLILKRAEGDRAAELLDTSRVLEIASTPLTPERADFAAQSGIDVADSGRAGLVFASVPSWKVREGMRRALRMGTYFASRARQSETARWKLATIETEYTAVLSGEFKIATVAVGGQLTLVFSRLPN